MKSRTTDRRADGDKPHTAFYVVATDRFMSGWGGAPGVSYFAVPCRDEKQADIAERNMKARDGFLRVRTVAGDYRPRLRSGDHLSIAALDCPWVQSG